MDSPGWSEELPTRDGFYWYYSDGLGHPQIVSVVNGKRYTFGENGNVLSIFRAGRWRGPFRPPAPPGHDDPAPGLLTWPAPLDPAAVVLYARYHGTPLGKERPRFGAGRVYTPAATRRYERAVRDLLRAELRLAPPDALSAFGVRCHFARPTRHRVDCDNLLKSILDAANGVVWADDAQVVEFAGRRVYADPQPRAEILIYRVPG